MHSAMFISRPETIWLDKGMLQAFVEDHQAHPIQTIPPFSFCNIPVIVLSGSAAGREPDFPPPPLQKFSNSCKKIGL